MGALQPTMFGDVFERRGVSLRVRSCPCERPIRNLLAGSATSALQKLARRCRVVESLSPIAQAAHILATIARNMSACATADERDPIELEQVD
jgi:hypothetical protein